MIHAFNYLVVLIGFRGQRRDIRGTIGTRQHGYTSSQRAQRPTNRKSSRNLMNELRSKPINETINEFIHRPNMADNQLKFSAQFPEFECRFEL